MIKNTYPLQKYSTLRHSSQHQSNTNNSKFSLSYFEGILNNSTQQYQYQNSSNKKNMQKLKPINKEFQSLNNSPKHDNSHLLQTQYNKQNNQINLLIEENIKLKNKISLLESSLEQFQQIFESYEAQKSTGSSFNKLVISQRMQIKQLENELTEHISTIDKLKRNTKFTSQQELEIEQQTLNDIYFKIRKYLHENKHVKLPVDRDKKIVKLESLILQSQQEKEELQQQIEILKKQNEEILQKNKSQELKIAKFPNDKLINYSLIIQNLKYKLICHHIEFNSIHLIFLSNPQTLNISQIQECFQRFPFHISTQESFDALIQQMKLTKNPYLVIDKETFLREFLDKVGQYDILDQQEFNSVLSKLKEKMKKSQAKLENNFKQQSRQEAIQFVLNLANTIQIDELEADALIVYLFKMYISADEWIIISPLQVLNNLIGPINENDYNQYQKVSILSYGLNQKLTPVPSINNKQSKNSLAQSESKKSKQDHNQQGGDKHSTKKSGKIEDVIHKEEKKEQIKSEKQIQPTDKVIKKDQSVGESKKCCSRGIQKDNSQQLEDCNKHDNILKQDKDIQTIEQIEREKSKGLEQIQINKCESEKQKNQKSEKSNGKLDLQIKKSEHSIQQEEEKSVVDDKKRQQEPDQKLIIEQEKQKRKESEQIHKSQIDHNKKENKINGDQSKNEIQQEEHKNNNGIKQVEIQNEQINSKKSGVQQNQDQQDESKKQVKVEEQAKHEEQVNYGQQNKQKEQVQDELQGQHQHKQQDKHDVQDKHEEIIKHDEQGKHNQQVKHGKHEELINQEQEKHNEQANHQEQGKQDKSNTEEIWKSSKQSKVEEQPKMKNEDQQKVEPQKGEYQIKQVKTEEQVKIEANGQPQSKLNPDPNQEQNNYSIAADSHKQHESKLVENKNENVQQTSNQQGKDNHPELHQSIKHVQSNFQEGNSLVIPKTIKTEEHQQK